MQRLIEYRRAKTREIPVPDHVDIMELRHAAWREWDPYEDAPRIIKNHVKRVVPAEITPEAERAEGDVPVTMSYDLMGLYHGANLHKYTHRDAAGEIVFDHDRDAVVDYVQRLVPERADEPEIVRFVPGEMPPHDARAMRHQTHVVDPKDAEAYFTWIECAFAHRRERCGGSVMYIKSQWGDKRLRFSPEMRFAFIYNTVVCYLRTDSLDDGVGLSIDAIPRSEFRQDDRLYDRPLRKRARHDGLC